MKPIPTYEILFCLFIALWIVWAAIITKSYFNALDRRRAAERKNRQLRRLLRCRRRTVYIRTGTVKTRPSIDYFLN